jgi:hypothetical protein
MFFTYNNIVRYNIFIKKISFEHEYCSLYISNNCADKKNVVQFL